MDLKQHYTPGQIVKYLPSGSTGEVVKVFTRSINIKCKGYKLRLSNVKQGFLNDLIIQ